MGEEDVALDMDIDLVENIKGLESDSKSSSDEDGDKIGEEQVEQDADQDIQ